MFSPLTAQMIQARQNEIEARAARAHNIDALRDLPDRKVSRRHFSLRVPFVSLSGLRLTRRAKSPQTAGAAKSPRAAGAA